jgi:chromate reductase
MTQLRIGVIVGSIRKASVNDRLAQALAGLAPQGMSFDRIRIDDLPLYNPDSENDPSAPVVRLKQQITQADGILFVTPEYNRSFPGVLKNAIDHASRPYGKSVWAGKPAGVIGASPGAIGTALAQQHLRNVLAYLNMPTLAQPEAFIQTSQAYFDAQGGVADESNRAFLSDWMQKFARWVDLHASSNGG